MTNNKTKMIAYNGLLAAVLIVMTLIPFLGLIQIPGLPAITVMLIPIIVGGYLFGFKSALFLSIIFGLGSIYAAMTRGAGLDLLFINPLVALTPRILTATLLGMVAPIFKRVLKNESLSIGATALVTSLVHTALVIITIFVALGLKGELTNETVMLFLKTVFFVNGMIEAVAAVLISIPVIKALKKTID